MLSFVNCLDHEVYNSNRKVTKNANSQMSLEPIGYTDLRSEISHNELTVMFHHDSVTQWCSTHRDNHNPVFF